MKEIEKFIIKIQEINNEIFSGKILDCCAGGDANHPMSYFVAIKNTLNKPIDTVDIREDSLAKTKADYLGSNFKNQYQTIITNPPFVIAQKIIEKAIDDVRDNGYVAMLQRLNFMGSKQRKEFWEKNIPKYIFVHHQRMSFTDDKKTDSIEYAHYVWQNGYKENFSQLFII